MLKFDKTDCVWHPYHKELLKPDGNLKDGYVGKLPTVNPLDLPYFMIATVGEYLLYTD